MFSEEGWKLGSAEHMLNIKLTDRQRGLSPFTLAQLHHNASMRRGLEEDLVTCMEDKKEAAAVALIINKTSTLANHLYNAEFEEAENAKNKKGKRLSLGLLAYIRLNKNLLVMHAFEMLKYYRECVNIELKRQAQEAMSKKTRHSKPVKDLETALEESIESIRKAKIADNLGRVPGRSETTPLGENDKERKRRKIQGVLVKK